MNQVTGPKKWGEKCIRFLPVIGNLQTYLWYFSRNISYKYLEDQSLLQMSAQAPETRSMWENNALMGRF